MSALPPGPRRRPSALADLGPVGPAADRDPAPGPRTAQDPAPGVSVADLGPAAVLAVDRAPVATAFSRDPEVLAAPDEPAALLALDLVGVAGRATTDRRLARMAAASGLSADEVHARIWASGFDEACDAGRHPLEEARAEVRRLLGVEASVDDLRHWWAAGLEPDAEVLALVDRVRERGVPTALLTNNGPLLLDALEHHELDAVWRRFDRHCFCCAYRVRKPERAAYEAFAADVGMPLGRIAFVDDAPRNVDGAIEAGMRAHLHEGDVVALEGFLAGQGLV